MTDEQLSALLRLKRFEKPPAQYFDQLLQDIHRRQRTELLHRPLWKIALERVQTLFSEHSMGHASYAGAMAAVLVLGIGTIRMLTPGDLKPSAVIAQEPAPAAEGKYVTLQTSGPTPTLHAPPFPTAQPRFAPVIHQPRDGMDARPVSYEPSSSFNF